MVLERNLVEPQGTVSRRWTERRGGIIYAMEVALRFSRVLAKRSTRQDITTPTNLRNSGDSGWLLYEYIWACEYCSATWFRSSRCWLLSHCSWCMYALDGQLYVCVNLVRAAGQRLLLVGSIITSITSSSCSSQRKRFGLRFWTEENLGC